MTKILINIEVLCMQCCTSINLYLALYSLNRSHTNICFVENQLSRGTIGLSPLSTALRRIMQHSTVRSIIIWPWKDHLASGLIIVTCPLLSFKLYTVAFAKAFNLATIINLLTHYAKGTSLFYLRISTAYRITNSVISTVYNY